MPDQKNLLPEINLLPKDSFRQSPMGKFLTWALSTGRYIVVFTEMMVILTFLSRFTLDRQLSDLNEQISQKQSILESLVSFEDLARDLQAKAEFVTQPSNEDVAYEDARYLMGIAGEDLVYKQIDITREKILIKGDAYSQETLSGYVDKLRGNDGYSDVDVGKIETSNNDARIEFEIKLQQEVGK